MSNRIKKLWKHIRIRRILQNEQGSNLVIIPKSGTTGVRAFLAGIGGTAKNVAPANAWITSV